MRDFERAAEAAEAASAEQQAGAEPPAERRDADDIFGAYADKWHAADGNRNYAANRGVHDLGYDVFDEHTHAAPSKARVVVGFGNEDHVAGASLVDEQTETLHNEYMDPLAASRVEEGPPSIDELIDGRERAVRYAPNTVERLATAFASGALRPDAMLEEWWTPRDTYRSARWLSDDTERRFRAWHASERRYRTEDEWRAMLVPACARRYYSTVHEVGALKTLVLFARDKVFLSVVLERHAADAALYRLHTHYYTFSEQMLARLMQHEEGAAKNN